MHTTPPPTPHLTFTREMRDALDRLAPNYPTREALLLPGLTLAQQTWGALSLEAVEATAVAVGVAPVRALAVAEFYSLYHKHPVGKYHIRLCKTLPCRLAGAIDILKVFERILNIKNGETTTDGLFTLETVECLGSCGSAPVAYIVANHGKNLPGKNQCGDYFEFLDEAAVLALVEKLRKDAWEEIPRPRLFPGRQSIQNIQRTTYAIQTEKFGIENIHQLEIYRASGGYQSLMKAISRKPEEIVEEVKLSGLRGRGGAGFPTGLKWSFLPKDRPRSACLCVNGDEGEPGAFKDRYLLEIVPHQVLEGVLIACWANHIEDAYIFIRGEFETAIERMRTAIKDAERAGICGDRLLNTGQPCRVTVHTGAGAYICGEETGLIGAIEGKKGFPRLKPPYPAIAGLFHRPTLINNVETLAAIPWIAANGGLAHSKILFSAKTSPKSPGTKLFNISGHVEHPGLYEVALGMPFTQFLNSIAGGVRKGKKLKAVIPGGVSSKILTAAEAETITLDYESIDKAGSMLGSGSIVILDEETDLVAALSNLMDFYAHESCGQCTPCREGCPWAAKILRKICAGKGKRSDLDLLLDIANGMEGKTVCALATAAAWPLRSYITKFRSEFERHVR